MSDAARFFYLAVSNALGQTANRPISPVTLASLTQSGNFAALVDSGADANILPYNIGLQLGLRWEEQPNGGYIRGVFELKQTRLVELGVKISDFAVIPLVFIWTAENSIPLIFGQFNFFEEFDVCFFRSRGYFEIRPKQS